MTAPFSFIPSLSLGGKNLVVLTAPNNIREIVYKILRYKYSNIFDVDGGEPTIVTISPREKYTMSQTVAMGAAVLYYAVLKAAEIDLESMWRLSGEQHHNRIENFFSFADWIKIPEEEFLKSFFDLLLKMTGEYAEEEKRKVVSLLGIGDFQIWIGESEKIVNTLGLLNPSETVLGKDGIELRIQECNQHIETIRDALVNATSINAQLKPIIDSVGRFVAGIRQIEQIETQWRKSGHTGFDEFIAQIIKYADQAEEIRKRSKYRDAIDAYRTILSYKVPEAKAK